MKLVSLVAELITCSTNDVQRAQLKPTSQGKINSNTSVSTECSET